MADAGAAGMAADGVPLRDGGVGVAAYAEAVITYLAFAIDRLADRNSNICSWDSSRQHARNVFARQAIQMTWDFTENNPVGSSSGSWSNCVAGLVKVVRQLPASTHGEAVQRDARARVGQYNGAGISTDPPYYDNVPYADISDFFYVWMRKNLSTVWPDEFSTLVTPKAEELVADNVRAGSTAQAEAHFESGMAEFMAEVAEHQPADVPATIYYAYKATETKEGEIRTTGWDTFLQAVLDAGLQVNATWPMRDGVGEFVRARIGVPMPSRHQSSLHVGRAAHRQLLLLAASSWRRLRRELPEAGSGVAVGQHCSGGHGAVHYWAGDQGVFPVCAGGGG